MPSRLGSVADIEASTRLNRPPTPFQASPTVLPSAVTRSLAVPIGLSAVRHYQCGRASLNDINEAVGIAVAHAVLTGSAGNSYSNSVLRPLPPMIAYCGHFHESMKRAEGRLALSWRERKWGNGSSSARQGNSSNSASGHRSLAGGHVTIRVMLRSRGRMQRSRRPSLRLIRRRPAV